MNHTHPARGSLAYVYLLAAVAALGGLLFGYDTAVISGALGFLEAHFDLAALPLPNMPQWAADFCQNVLLLDPADPRGFWKGWAAACALLGCALGAGSAGWLSDRFGRRTTLVFCAIAFLISALGTALPSSFHVFVVFRVIGGLAIGAASLTSPMYIAEISPAAVRGRMVSVNQFAIVTGMVVVYFINYFIAWYGEAVDLRAGLPSAVARQAKQAAPAEGDAVPPADEAPPIDPQSWNAQRGWRWMFGSGALPSLLLLGLLVVVPESPRWLAKRGRRDEARRVLTRVGGPQRAAAELAEIEDALAHETGSLRQLFAPGLRTALAIGVLLAVFQQITGINVFLYYAPEILKQTGATVDVALLQTVLVGAVNMAFTIIAIWTVDRLGRKPLMLIGFAGMGATLAALGTAIYLQQTSLWVLGLMLGYVGCFALSVGPVTWVILSEIFPTQIRGRAMALATVCLWLANFVVTLTFTIMDDKQGWLVQQFHHAFPYWLYAGLSAAAMLFVWRFVPETKGKSLEEIERGWQGR